MRNIHFVLLVAAFFHSPVLADVQIFTTLETWQAATGQVTGIAFIGYDNFTPITDQYQDLGIVFTDGDDFFLNSPSFIDNAGISSSATGQAGSIGAEFDLPRNSLALDFLDSMKVQFWIGETLVYESPSFGTSFRGFISTDPFDRVVMIDPGDQVASVDNLYFGNPIPAPGALAFIAIAVIARARRRRHP